MDKRCRIRIVSHRHRLCDADGISAKAAIDGLVDAGVLRDDSPAEVEEVSYGQEHIGRKLPEITVITIEEV